MNVVAPQLEVVGELHSAPMAPEDAPSMRAMKLMGANFKEFNSNSTVMVVIEGQQPLGPTRTTTTTRSSASSTADPEHIQHIQDFWGDTLTAAGAQSADGKASYVMLNLRRQPGRDAGQRRRSGRPQGHRGHEGPARREGLRRGPGRADDDLQSSATRASAQITLITLIVIAGMLLVVYRSIVTMLISSS